MEFKDIMKQLNRKQMEDLLTEAFAPRDAGPFSVENIRTIGNKKEVDIRYMGTQARKTIVVGG